ncbi:unnamed protein product [Parascedosporium putredinis]|uniref:Uncharacterized protein n=1 Tax=Parascedosporium putredinis TaxID=1442378 RepID=A0A9P1MB65_9PEZI|nr:unnamed protein product [Parascedosporium putredinis]CAI7998914.1 unnamed protein product [Parascedosporium putredinis]
MSESVAVGMAPAAVLMTEPKAPSPCLDSSNGASGPTPDIIDIRRTLVEMNLKDEIFTLFEPAAGPRKLPTLLLYNEKGLQLFEEVNTSPTAHSPSIRRGQITYLEEYYLTNYEIDVLKQSAQDIASRIPKGAMIIELGSGNLRKVCLLLQALEDAQKHVEYYALDLSKQELERTLAQVPDFQYVTCKGLLGTYDDGRNFDRREAADFLTSFSSTLGPSDMMLIGVDSCADPAKVYHAYNDRQGLTHRFILNGLSQANEVLGDQIFDENDWKVIGEYVYDEQGGGHRAFYSPIRDTVVLGKVVRSYERIQVEQSLKYSADERDRLWATARLTEIGHWSKGDEYGLHLLQKQPDILRNACIFYLGHIPTFLDIQLTKTSGEAATEPGYFWDIFERGIDPDVDNPELCHAHSKIPDEWPPVEEIIAYQEGVRARLRRFYRDGPSSIPRAVQRGIWVGFEHEAMHFETLLYMMLQSDKTQPPPTAPRPDFEGLAYKARQSRVTNMWHDVPEQVISIGIDDPEDGTEDYATYLYENNLDGVPASWANLVQKTPSEGRSSRDSSAPSDLIKNIAVRTVYGLIPLEYALDWPVFASYDELSGCAAWMGGRIPTFEEARSLYSFTERSETEKAEQTLGKTVPAVNRSKERDTWELASNPVTDRGDRLGGQAAMGGVWEWTSSPLRKHDGFEPMTLYPAYTADFFDEKHNIVLGGSWATHPRIAGRKSFVNWYQRNYMYAWVGARLVRDKPQV